MQEWVTWICNESASSNSFRPQKQLRDGIKPECEKIVFEKELKKEN